MSKTFCAYFWNHICVRHDDRVMPCCRFLPDYADNIGFGEGFDGFNNSDFFKELRKKALNGEKIEGCRKCYQQEAGGIPSLRHVANQMNYPQNLEIENTEDNINYLEVFVGDICNLKCLTCGPELSTSWRDDYKKLGWEMSKRSQSSNKISLIESLNNLEEIKFVGGEPFLSQEHDNILKALVKKAPKNLKLVYYSNITIFPKQEIIDMWKNFKEVTIWLSIDGVGKVNEYVRFPSQWKIIEENVHRILELSEHMENLKICFLTTVSLYNVWTIDKMELWQEELKKLFPRAQMGIQFFNPVINPAFLKITNLPVDMIEKLKKQLDEASVNQKRMLDFIESQYDGSFDQTLVDYTEKLDRTRGVSVKEYIPELASLWGSTK